MLFNANKNVGEVFEYLKEFSQAKFHYTNALKIQPKDAYIWTRLGYLHFDQFQDLALSQQCFEAASRTLGTLEKRGNKICPILVKLAEISFLDYDFKKSESIVDTILARPLSDNDSLVFALLMKSYFSGLQNQNSLAIECLRRAQSIRPGVQIQDLQVMKTNAEQMLIRQKQSLMFCPVKNKLISIDGNPKFANPKIELNAQTLQQVDGSFPHFFLVFVQQIGFQLESYLEQNSIEMSHDLVLDCKQFQNYLQEHQQTMLEKWADSFTHFDVIVEDDWTMPENQDKADGKTPQKQNIQSAKKQTEAAKRGLRRKLDDNDLKMRQLKLDGIDHFKEFVIDQNQDLFMEITSQRDVLAIKNLFQQKITGRQQTQTNVQASADHTHESGNENNAVIPDASLFSTFVEILEHLQDKSVFYAIRNLLRFVVDEEGWPLLIDQTAYDVFKLFQLVLKASNPTPNTLGQQNYMDQFGSYQVILVMFELALFNKTVMKKVKSGPIMTLSKHLNDYLQQFANSEVIVEKIGVEQRDQKYVREGYALYMAAKQFDKHSPSSQNDYQRSFDAFKVRLYFSLMYYAFEILNDMNQSVLFYQWLDLTILKDQGALKLRWIGPRYVLDHEKVKSFGSCKIIEAQKVRDYDQAIKQMKLQEVEALKKKFSSLNSSKKIKPECINYAHFYLEQLFNYLSLSTLSQSNESSNMSFSSNEDKIKEMWDKLCYSLCRSETHHLLNISQHVLSTLQAYQFFQKGFFDSVLLKRISFDGLIGEISIRIKEILTNVWNIVQQHQNSNLCDLSQQINTILQQKLNAENPWLKLQKLQNHLLSLFNPEFLYINARQHSVGVGELDNHLIQSAFESLFSIQTLISLIKLDHFKSTADNFQSVTLLLKCCDKVAKANQDLFMKPYTYLVQFAFPLMVHLFSKIADESIQQANQEQIYQLAESELCNFVGSCLKFFFGFTMDIDELKLGHQSSKPADEEMKTEKESSDSDEEMSLYVSLIAPKKLPVVEQPSSNLTPQQQFIKLALKSEGLDVVLLSDLICTVNFCCQGRLLGHSQMTLQDLKKTFSLTETIGNLVFAKRAWISDRHPESKLRCNKVKQQFKEVSFDDDELFKQGTEIYDRIFQKSISIVLFYLLNVMTQIGLPTSASLVQGLSINQRVSFLEKLPSINDLKKLRALSHIDLQYGDGLEVTTLIMSYVFLQLYQESNENKVHSDYKLKDDYKSSKSMRNQAVNSALSSINFILSNPSPQRQGWKYLSQIELLKLAFRQLLQISLLRLKGKEHTNFFANFTSKSKLDFKELQTNHNDSKIQKIKHIKAEAFLYATICSKLDGLILPKADPRVKQISQQQLDATGFKIAQYFTDAVKITQTLQKQNPPQKSNPLIFQEQIDLCLGQMNNMISQNTLISNVYQLVPKSRLSFDFPYLMGDMKVTKSGIVNSDIMNNFKNALEIAIAANNSGGVFQVMMRIVELAIKMSIEMKYTQNSLTEELKFSYNHILKDIVSKQVLANSSLKHFLNTFSTLVADNQNEGEENQGQDHFPIDLDYGHDPDAIILEKHASSQIRQKLLKTNTIPEFDVHENILQQLYELADRFIHMLATSSQKLTSSNNPQGSKYHEFQKSWLKIQYNQILSSSLHQEFQAFQILHNKQMRSSQGWVLIREMQSQTLKEVLNIDEIQSIYMSQQIQQWNTSGGLSLNVITNFQGFGWQQLALSIVNSSLNQFFNIENDQTDKSMENEAGRSDPRSLISISQLNAFGFGILRADIKRLLLDLCNRSIEYEPIRELSKKSVQAFKQNLAGPSQSEVRSVCAEIQAVFQLSKDATITLLVQNVEKVYRTFIQVRSDMKRVATSQSGQGYAQVMKAYKEFRKGYAASRDSIPQLLKDVFEAFVDAHYSKQFLKKYELISDAQKKRLRLCVLQISAICGPDPELGGNSNKVTSQFINLAKITSDEYTFEGLMICIKWFAGVLDGSANSDKMTGANKQRGGKTNIELQKKLLATLDEIEKSVKGIQPISGYQQVKSQTVLPQQVFRGPQN